MDALSVEAARLESAPFLLEQQRVHNCNKAKYLRDEAKKCLDALDRLRTGTLRQRMAGFDHGKRAT